MVTKFGRFIRHLRLDFDITLKDMADILDVSPAMLSGVENGNKSIPLNWEKIIIDHFRLSDVQKAKLHEYILESINQIRVNTSEVSLEKVDLAVLFARNFEKMSEEKSKEMKELLKKIDEVDELEND